MDYWRVIQRRLHSESALHYPRNEVRKILKAYINGTLNEYEDNSRLFREQGFLLTCQGAYLDERGNEMGLPRKKGKVATGTVTFHLINPASSTLVIPKDFVIESSITGYGYTTTKNATIEVGETDVTVTVQAIASGKRYNAIESELTVIDTTYVSSDLSVTNEIQITGGVDGETDAEYRQRLFNSISTHLTVNYLKKQGIIIYSKKKYDNDIRIKMSSLNPYLNNEYAAIPPKSLINYLNKEIIHNRIMQIYIKGWEE